MDNNFRQKAYKILYEKYKKAYINTLKNANNALKYGNSKDCLKFLETIINEDTSSIDSVISQEDKNTINTIEYLLDDEREDVK